MMHFDWMVYDRIDREGIWFLGSRSGSAYVFYWNPMRLISGWRRSGAYLGWFPMTKNHINFK